MISFLCGKCTWYDNQHESLVGLPKSQGYCHKKYPVVYSKYGRYFGMWPIVEKTGFCGEFKADAVEVSGGMPK